MLHPKNYVLRSDVTLSPPHKGILVCYLHDDPTPLRLTLDEWTVIQALIKGHNPDLAFAQLLRSSSKSNISKPAYSSIEAFAEYFIQSGLLEIVSEQYHRQVSSPISSPNSYGLVVLTMPAIRNTIFAPLASSLWSIQRFLFLPALLVFFLLLTHTLSISRLADPLGTFPAWHADSGLAILSKLVTSLLAINLSSSLITLVFYSHCNKGSRSLYITLMYGFIPRFKVKPYWGARDPSPPARLDQLLLMAQPILIRVYLINILLFSKLVSLPMTRSHQNDPSHLASVADAIIWAALLSLVELSLPVFNSPGYRILTTFTQLSPAFLNRSILACVRSFQYRTSYIISSITGKPSSYLSSHPGKVLTPQAFLMGSLSALFIVLKFTIVGVFIIPPLSQSFNSLLGFATDPIVLTALLLLFATFLYGSFRRVRVYLLGTKPVPSQSDHHSLNARSNLSSRTRSRHTSFIWALIALLISVVPVNRTVTASLTVNSERSLTIRANQDVDIENIYIQGPSRKIIAAGTPLLQLKSVDLDLQKNATDSQQQTLQASLSDARSTLHSSLQSLRALELQLSATGLSQKIKQSQSDTYRILADSGVVSRTQANERQIEYLSGSDHEQDLRKQQVTLISQIKATRDQISALTNQLLLLSDRSRQIDQQITELLVRMPFDGVLHTSTTDLLNARFQAGEPIVKVSAGSVNLVDVLVADYDRKLVNLGQDASVRLYSLPNTPFSGKVDSIQATAEQVNDQSYFRTTLKLNDYLQPKLIDSSGIARINTGTVPLIVQLTSGLSRFVLVDLWSWLP